MALGICRATVGAVLMSDASDVFVPILIAGSISAVVALKDGDTDQGMRILVGNTALFAGLSAVGQFIDWDLARMVAVLNLLYVILSDGEPVIDWVNKFVSGVGSERKSNG